MLDRTLAREVAERSHDVAPPYAESQRGCERNLERGPCVDASRSLLSSQQRGVRELACAQRRQIGLSLSELKRCLHP